MNSVAAGRAARRDEQRVESVSELRQAAKVCRWLARLLDVQADVLVRAGLAEIEG